MPGMGVAAGTPGQRGDPGTRRGEGPAAAVVATRVCSMWSVLLLAKPVPGWEMRQKASGFLGPGSSPRELGAFAGER